MNDAKQPQEDCSEVGCVREYTYGVLTRIKHYPPCPHAAPAPPRETQRHHPLNCWCGGGGGMIGGDGCAVLPHPCPGIPVTEPTRSLAGEAAQPREIKAKDLANVVEWLIQQDLALYPEGFRQNGIAISSDLESSVILIMERYATSRLAVSTPPAQLGNEFADFVQVEYREGKAYLKLHIDNALDFTLSEYPTLAGAEQDATMVRGALVQLFNKLKFRLTPPVASAPVSKVLLNELREISVLIFSRAQSTPEGADLENISFRLDDLIKTAEAAALSPAQAVPSEWKDWNACQSCRITQGCIHFCDEHWKQFQTAEPSAQAVAGEPRKHNHTFTNASMLNCIHCGIGIGELAAPEPVAEPQDQVCPACLCDWKQEPSTIHPDQCYNGWHELLNNAKDGKVG